MNADDAWGRSLLPSRTGQDNSDGSRDGMAMVVNRPVGGIVRSGVGRAECVTDVPADEEVVRELYQLHGGALLGFVLRLVDGDRQRAEDVVQETLLRAWRNPEALAEQRGSTQSWLFTVARNLVIDSVRARAARPTEVGDGALWGLAAEDSVETEIERASLGWEVADALAGLAAHHRDVLVQTYFLGRSVAEAADVLKIPPGTVKSRTYYALRQLRLTLEERGVSADGLAGEVTG